MGRERVLNTIKKQGRGLLIGGSILFVVGFLPSALFFWVYRGFDPLHVIFAFPLIVGMIMLFFGIRYRFHPEKAECFKKNPDLLLLADELYGNVLYEDDFIIFSDRVIANKENITQMTFFKDIIWIYESEMKQDDLITTLHEVVIETKLHRMEINVFGKNDETVQSLMDRIYQLCAGCSQARIGYSEENQAYCKEMLKKYRK